MDAAEYRHDDAYALALVNRPNDPPVCSLAVRTPCPATAEEAAIALALSQRPTPTIVISDSKTAVQNFARGLISPLALKIITQNPPTSPVELLWAPAHSVLGEDEAAHNAARGLTIRAGASLVPYHGARSARDSLITYHDITMHYRLARRKYPPAHPQLNHEQVRTLRLLSPFPAGRCSITSTLPSTPHLIVPRVASELHFPTLCGAVLLIPSL